MPIRFLASHDWSSALDINQAAVPEVGALDIGRLEHILGQSILALGAYDPDHPSQLVGFCIVLGPGADYGSVNYRWFSERYDDFVYLDRVAIDVAHRGRGIGRALYEEVEKRVDAHWFTLEVNLRPRNESSLAFHRAMGFVEVGQQETDYGFLVSMQAKLLG